MTYSIWLIVLVSRYLMRMPSDEVLSNCITVHCKSGFFSLCKIKQCASRVFISQYMHWDSQTLAKKDDSDYLVFKETTWWYSKFVYSSTFLSEPIPPLSQPIQICCTTMTSMQTELQYVHLYFFGVPLMSVPNHVWYDFDFFPQPFSYSL